MSDFFPSFEQRQIGTSGATINLVTGTSGPPLLLLHGYPQERIRSVIGSPILQQSRIGVAERADKLDTTALTPVSPIPRSGP